ncbi:HRDC domain-containing protein [Georgenia sp. Z1491]|uniref:HRDC domain-containing protein n=1 Tax=Georgenia sp. Z1491 TaxID=3416707 RepID=UPI003CF63D47
MTADEQAAAPEQVDAEQDGASAPEPLTEPSGGTPPVVDTPEALAAAVEEVSRTGGVLAVDAERASGFRYGQRAFLVQLRRSDGEIHLVDPVALPDLATLAEVVNPLEWVLHAADQDLPCLRELGLTPASLFDTEIAARLLGRARVGLAAVVADELGYALAKEHSAADWSTRPVPEDWRRYAALDVELLAAVREAQLVALARTGRLAWALQEFEHERLAPPPAPKVDPWRRTSGLQEVRRPRGLAVARAVWEARERLAKDIDRAPGRVLPAAAIVAAARELPESRHALTSLPEFSGKGTRRRADYWWAAVEEGLAAPEDALPGRRPPRDPDALPQPRSWGDARPDAAVRLDAVRTALRARADEIGIPQENLLAPAIQRRVSWDGVEPAELDDALRAHGARPWQIEQAGAVLASALADAAR